MQNVTCTYHVTTDRPTSFTSSGKNPPIFRMRHRRIRPLRHSARPTNKKKPWHTKNMGTDIYVPVLASNTHGTVRHHVYSILQDGIYPIPSHQRRVQLPEKRRWLQFHGCQKRNSWNHRRDNNYYQEHVGTTGQNMGGEPSISIAFRRSMGASDWASTPNNTSISFTKNRQSALPRRIPNNVSQRCKNSQLDPTLGRTRISQRVRTNYTSPPAYLKGWHMHKSK